MHFYSYISRFRHCATKPCDPCSSLTACALLLYCCTAQPDVCRTNGICGTPISTRPFTDFRTVPQLVNINCLQAATTLLRSAATWLHTSPAFALDESPACRLIRQCCVVQPGGSASEGSEQHHARHHVTNQNPQHQGHQPRCTCLLQEGRQQQLTFSRAASERHAARVRARISWAAFHKNDCWKQVGGCGMVAFHAGDHPCKTAASTLPYAQ